MILSFILNASSGTLKKLWSVYCVDVKFSGGSGFGLALSAFDFKLQNHRYLICSNFLPHLN